MNNRPVTSVNHVANGAQGGWRESRTPEFIRTPYMERDVEAVKKLVRFLVIAVSIFIVVYVCVTLFSGEELSKEIISKVVVVSTAACAIIFILLFWHSLLELKTSKNRNSTVHSAMDLERVQSNEQNNNGSVSDYNDIYWVEIDSNSDQYLTTAPVHDRSTGQRYLVVQTNNGLPRATVGYNPSVIKQLKIVDLPPSYDEAMRGQRSTMPS